MKYNTKQKEVPLGAGGKGVSGEGITCCTRGSCSAEVEERAAQCATSAQQAAGGKWLLGWALKAGKEKPS